VRRSAPREKWTALVYVWAGLLMATVLSFWLGAEHAIGPTTPVWSVLVVFVAFVKVRFIGLYFMELRSAPRLLRAAYEAWCLAACVTLIAIYLV
jgi:heme/copper-type cytochrome/quinol oxidase subunit 4